MSAFHDLQWWEHIIEKASTSTAKQWKLLAVEKLSLYLGFSSVRQILPFP
jgi:hypothetical protein